ncbi:hypothetical protein N6B72_04915 [Chryseobacterium soli]|uniref:hypothetical protein n=1 Tax=Chryseobacterium soli TaxID=445961 RepID=UPI002955A71F|nr:hypothetical protein [Chryseobacterium soli]MDV7696259.1 hypothetical protein [Chryseobacterium soli]
MDKNLFKQMSPKDRADNLQAMAHSTEQTKYSKILTQDEIDERRERLTENYIKFSDLESEKKSLIEDIKAKQKPLQVDNVELLQTLKTKSERVEGVLYHVDDQDEGMMHSFDADGDLITSRRLRPDEKVASMFNINQQIAK